jgi:hypothetical protein
MSRASLRSLALLLTELVTVSTPALLFAQIFQLNKRFGMTTSGIFHQSHETKIHV